jgi:hypothetical protein
MLSTHRGSVGTLATSFYFIVGWPDAKHYSDALKALAIPHVVETPKERSLRLNPASLLSSSRACLFGYMPRHERFLVLQGSRINFPYDLEFTK